MTFLRPPGGKHSVKRDRILDVLPADDAVLAAQSVDAEPRFSGLAWDTHRRVWVLWHDGRPLTTFGAKPE